MVQTRSIELFEAFGDRVSEDDPMSQSHDDGGDGDINDFNEGVSPTKEVHQTNVMNVI